MRTLRALLIEDSPDDADLLVRELRRAEYDVVYERADTAEAVRAALSREWDVILSDYELSEISGLDALEIVQELAVDVPFIIISGNIGEEAAASLMRHGADDYLTKENLSRLVPAIRREMDEAENRREKRKAEQALAQSEERLQLALDAAGLGAWERDLVTHDVFWSRETAALLGVSVGGAKFEGLHSQIVEEDRPMLQAKYDEAIRTRMPISVRFRIKKRGGEIIWVSESARCEYDENGTPLRLVGTIKDVTRDKLAEDALIEAEERYRVMAETASDAVISIDGDSVIIYANPATEGIFGYKPTELAGNPLTILIPESSHKAHLAGIRRYMKTGEKTVDWRRTETTGRRKDGTEIAIQISFGHYRKNDKHFFTGFVRDISEAKAAEDLLLRSQEKYSDLINSVDGIVWEADVATLQFTFVSKQAESILGYPLEKWCEKGFWEEKLHPDDRKWAIEFCSASTKDKAPHTFEYRMIAADGSVVWLRDIVTVVVENDEPVTLRGIMVDVTEQRRKDAALKRQALLIEQANEAIFVWDLEKGIVEWNKGCERLYGYTRDEMLGKFGFEVLRSTIPFTHEEFVEFLKANGEWAGEVAQTKKDGEKVYAVSRYQLIDLDSRRTVLQTNRDISERIAAEEALKASEEQLRQAQKLESIGILAGGMAHDFNNMLTAINGYSDLVLRKLPADDPIRKNVEEIRNAGERSAELTRQLLAFSRRQILQPTSLNLNETIEETTSLLRRLIGEDITVTTRLHPELWMVEADPGQLSQVLMNLAINARDAMPTGGSLMIETSNVMLDEKYASRHIEVEPGRYVMLAISDTGIGMDEETRRRVFEPFFTTKSVGRGTGLGLSTVYGIVKQSGGNIWVYSEPDRGTTFKIYLREASAEDQGEDLEISQRDLHLGSETILLVEDEGSVRGLACEILEACGYTVVEAEDGKEALKKFEQIGSPVDLLVTDVVMPNMGGRELSENLLRACPDMKVLFTSGYTDDAILRHGITDEGTNFLQKPFTFASLSRKVRNLLDSSK